LPSASPDFDRRQDDNDNNNDNQSSNKESPLINAEAKATGEQNNKYRTERAVYQANMAACHIKLKEYQLAIEECSTALELDPSYMRALQRKAQAEELVGTFASMTQAKEDHLKVVETLKIELGLIPPPKEDEKEPTPIERSADTAPSSTSSVPTSKPPSPAAPKRPERPQPMQHSDSRTPTYRPKRLELDQAGKQKHRMLLQSSEQALKRMEPILKEMLEKEKAEMMGKGQDKNTVYTDLVAALEMAHTR
jgi:tetratricopeptide (TPR) repeat protein